MEAREAEPGAGGASSSVAGDQDEHGDGAGAARVNMLVCASCRFPLVAESQIVRQRFQSTFDQAVYSYELDVLDKEVWCYSATNPNDYRFDVVRARPLLRGKSPFKFHGSPTPEHSWFAGFSWSMCHCAACDAHLGWGFSPNTPPRRPKRSKHDAPTASAEPHTSMHRGSDNRGHGAGSGGAAVGGGAAFADAAEAAETGSVTATPDGGPATGSIAANTAATNLAHAEPAESPPPSTAAGSADAADAASAADMADAMDIRDSISHIDTPDEPDDVDAVSTADIAEPSDTPHAYGMTTATATARTAFVAATAVDTMPASSSSAAAERLALAAAQGALAVPVAAVHNQAQPGGGGATQVENEEARDASVESAAQTGGHHGTGTSSNSTNGAPFNPNPVGDAEGARIEGGSRAEATDDDGMDDGSGDDEYTDEDSGSDDDVAMSRFEPVGTYPGLEFCGLVLTKLAQESLTVDQLEDFEAKRQSVSAHQMTFAAHMREIKYRLNQVPTVLAAPFYEMIHAMQVAPENRLRSGNILSLIRSSLDQLFATQEAEGDHDTANGNVDARASGDALSSDVDSDDGSGPRQHPQDTGGRAERELEHQQALHDASENLDADGSSMAGNVPATSPSARDTMGVGGDSEA